MKPGSYTQVYIQVVFAVKYRERILKKEFRSRVFEYMSGILKTMKHKPIIVNGVEDHVHVFFGLNPAISISDTVHDIKRGSSLWINEQMFCNGKFAWQEGYGAFSYSRDAIDSVYRYIENQESHHAEISFKDEYRKFLNEFDVAHDEKYLFEFFD
ncbi:MAG: IS200/IS605 family transposase [Flavobacteriales bacterium]